MPWYAPRNVSICVQPPTYTSGTASICFRYASSITSRSATSVAVAAALAAAGSSCLGGRRGSRCPENMPTSALWLDRKCE